MFDFIGLWWDVGFFLEKVGRCFFYFVIVGYIVEIDCWFFELCGNK